MAVNNYDVADRLVARANAADIEGMSLYLAEAQVHATLALVDAVNRVADILEGR